MVKWGETGGLLDKYGTAALYFYMMAYGLPVNEDEWGADI